MYRLLTIILSLFIFTLSNAQSDLDWEDHFSYYQIQDIARSGSTFFVGAQNTVFIYNQATGNIEKISSIQGLSSQNISKIHFSASYNLLFIGYETGLIDVYNLQTKNVFKLVDIPNKTGIPPSERRINDMLEDGTTPAPAFMDPDDPNQWKKHDMEASSDFMTNRELNMFNIANRHKLTDRKITNAVKNMMNQLRVEDVVPINWDSYYTSEEQLDE